MGTTENKINTYGEEPNTFSYYASNSRLRASQDPINQEVRGMESARSFYGSNRGDDSDDSDNPK